MSLASATLNVAFSAYKRVFSPMLHSFGVSRCVYLPTCSEYAHIAISRYGLVKGTGLALARIARCNPLAKGGLDPVP